ncbi:MAG: molybdopterin molybdotransferase MoeA [Bacteroidales bacterium]|nr:molybdopterin molybdotransferase MoeA [Bacteroidales bacterium]
MIKFEEALEIVEKSAFRLETERIDLNESLNRILAEDVKSDMEMPPFNKSAVDGYACKKEDLLNEMEVIEIIPAGKEPRKAVGINQCSKIMTGAPMPDGADTVLMVEDVEDITGNRIRYLKDKVKDNICYRGEDIKEGEIVIKKGTLIKPQQIAVMATAGCVNPIVYRQVRIAVISTGDELVEPGIKPAPSQIRNSNAYQLLSQVKNVGAIPNYIGIALDTEESTRQMLKKAFEDNDIILLTGGVSMGDYDYVPQVLNELGVKIFFKSIAVQPGRPTVFGTRDKQFIFGLPGNPVSSFVQFELLVKPLIYKLSGFDYKLMKIKLPMGKEYSRKRSARLSWLPVQISNNGEVFPMDYHGSAHINSLTEADGMISVPIGKTELKKGDLVDVRQI